MNWLITGANGFLGHYCCSRLETLGHDIQTLDRQNPFRPGGLTTDLSQAVPDLGNERIEAVLHLAYRSRLPAGQENLNLVATNHLLEALQRHNAGLGVFVLTSSMAVYGCRKGNMLDETTLTNPSSNYGRVKLEIEKQVSDWCTQNNVRCVILRLPMIVGARSSGNLTRMIKAMKKRRYVGIGTGLSRRSMVLADDVARFLPRLATTQGIYHLTDGTHSRVLDMERAICQKLRRPLPLRIPLWLATSGGRFADVLQRNLSIQLPVNSEVISKISETLTFDDQLARESLQWNPRPVFDCIDDWFDQL